MTQTTQFTSDAAAGVKLLLKGCGSPTYPVAKMHESIASPSRDCAREMI